MPIFETIPKQEAIRRTATKRRDDLVKEYTRFLAISPEQAGLLRASEGETTAAVRRRLGSAARANNRKLVIKRVGDDIYFWSEVPARRRDMPKDS